MASPWELWAPPSMKKLCLQSKEQEPQLSRAVNNAIFKKYVWVPVCSCEAQGKLHMLLHFYLVLSDGGSSGSAQAAGDGAGPVPAHSSAGTPARFRRSNFWHSPQLQCCWFCSETSHTYVLWRHLWGFTSASVTEGLRILTHPTRKAPESQGQKEGTLSTTSAVASMHQRDLGEGNKLSLTSTSCSCWLEEER